MQEFVELEFRTETIFYYPRPKFELFPGKYAVIKVDRGFDIAKVVSTSMSIDELDQKKITHRNNYIIRNATLRDLEKLNALSVEEQRATEIFNHTLLNYPLIMTLFSVVQQFDNKKITFLFTANERVDFREFVRELAKIFGKRIELVQISNREKSKMIF